jgi:putative peptidoglycan lipid II flippase
MYKNLFSVGALTLLSRAAGFFRDVMLGALLGTGVLADAFYIAFRLPNHFRTIFAEGAFNSAYVPCYARVLESQGPKAARDFASRIFTLLLSSQIVILALALVFTPQLLAALAPGLDSEPHKHALALTMTRITFPYLLCMTLMMQQSGTLNANGRFFAAAFAPVILNLVMMVCMALTFLFPNAGMAASWGVLLSGVAQLLMVTVAAWRANLLERFAWPTGDRAVWAFFRSFWPAVIGSAGVQIALFADTIIATLLPTGGISSIYYADRIYLLPIGVIGIAAGTVLLPEMSRRKSMGDPGAALRAQSRTMALTVALTAPFCIIFSMIPELIMRGVFVRGKFTEAAAVASGNVLDAYGVGLMAVVLIASARASFQSHGDTTMPMAASLISVAINVALKIFLFRPFGAPGLAFATAVGAWLNFGILVGMAIPRGLMRLDRTFWLTCGAVAAASVAGCLVVWYGPEPAALLTMRLPILRNAAQLTLVVGASFLAYAIVLAPLLAGLGVLPKIGGKPVPAALRS